MSTSAGSTRVIGFWTVTALVVGNMIGSGVFLLPSSLAPLGGGLAMLGWGLSAGGSILLALVFARLARRRPAAGGPYAYTREAFGDLAGFLVAWSYWISIWTTLAAIAVACVGYLDPFAPDLVRSPGSAAWLAVGLVWAVVLVNLRGVGAAGLVQVVTTALKLLPLVFIGLAGAASFDPTRFGLAAPAGDTVTGGAFLAVTLTLWAFLGLESGTVPAEAVVDPDRTIPRATIAGTLAAAGVYVVSTVGVMSLVPPEALAQSPAPFADAARALAGDGAARLVSLGAAISCLGALNGWTLLGAEMPRAIAADGLFPAAFARLSGRGVPGAGLVIAGVLATGLILMKASLTVVDLFTFTALLATLGALVPFVFCTLATIVLERPSERSPGRTLLSMAAFLFALVAIAGAGAETVYWGFLTLLAGLPVYVWVTRSRRGGGAA
jgi:APA family basic amino acid/polyamine antiporter